MLKIKLARFGKRNQPHYRIVVNEARDKRDGKYVAMVGHYAPAGKEKLLEIDVKEFEAWVAKGAQPTDTVAALFKRFKSGDPFPPKKKRPSKKAVAKAKAAKEEKEKPVEEPAPAAESKPAEEAPTETKTETEADKSEAPAEEKPTDDEKPTEEVKKEDEKPA